MTIMNKEITKHDVIKTLRNYLLVTIGVFILTFGTVIFLTEPQLVSGGISGIAIIAQFIVSKTNPNVQIYDIAVAILQVVTFVIGWIFLGKSFAAKTAYASLLYIGCSFLFIRVPYFQELAKKFAGTAEGMTSTSGDLILCALFGGVAVGGGVSLTFLGGGSTGGVDVFQFLLKKYLNIRQSIASFIIDGVVVIVGMIVMTKWSEALCGILCAFVASALIDLIFIKNEQSYCVDIISKKWEQINVYVQDVLGRGATIIPAKGGFQEEERIILRVVFDKNQYEKLREYIAKVDPHAFMTFTLTNAVYGEGFKTNLKKPKIVPTKTKTTKNKSTKKNG